MSAQAQSPEQRELSLVGKVEMRIALADNDNKLETILKTYLAPLLLKLASEHVSVRNKVISICQHVNTRIQPQSIQLPVAALVKQFKEQTNAFIRHFDLLYIQQGVPRLSAREKIELFPVVVSGIAGSGSHGSQIFYLMLRLLETFNLPSRGSKEDLELRTQIGVSDDDVSFLCSTFGKFTLYAPQKSGNSRACPGLTSSDYDFFNLSGKEDIWNPAAGGLNLTRSKTLAAKLTASGLFTDKERFLPALFASADPASAISDIGDDMLKRSLPVTDLEDKQLIARLFDLYFGEDGVPRVRAPLRMKILGLLSKSTISTTFATPIVKLVEDGVSAGQHDGADIVMSNGIPQTGNVGREANKLRAAVFTYINFVARFGDKDTLHSIAASVINKLRDYIENQGWPKPGNSEDLVSRGYAYEVVGLLARAGPKNILIEQQHASLDLLRWLFSSLAQDSSGNSIIVSIEDALSTVLNAMSRLTLNADEQSVLESLLLDQMNQSADLEAHGRLRSTRYVAVRLANRCLPYSSTKARWIDCLAAGALSDRPEVREEGERGLSPYWHRMLNGSLAESTDAASTISPQFVEVVDIFFRKSPQITSSDPAVLVHHTKRLYETSFPFLTAFARRMLISQALKDADVQLKPDSEWERRLDSMLESDVKARAAVRKGIQSTWERTPDTLDTILCALFEITTSKSTSSKDYLVEFLALAPNSFVENHVSKATSLIPILKSNDHTRRLTAAQTFGILASHPAGIEAQSVNVQELLNTAQDWSTLR